jgi:hypothetical protein
MTHTLSANWTKTRWQLSRDSRLSIEARQVICLTADQGAVWLSAYDLLPPAVRQRLAKSAFNICPTCLTIETPTPTVATYLAVIQAIESFERKLWAQTVTL